VVYLDSPEMLKVVMGADVCMPTRDLWDDEWGQFLAVGAGARSVHAA